MVAKTSKSQTARKTAPNKKSSVKSNTSKTAKTGKSSSSTVAKTLKASKSSTTRANSVAAVPELSVWGRIWRFVVSIAIPLVGGTVVGLLTKDNMNLLDSLKTPPLLPPDWVFPVAWSILYFLMGVACYQVWTMPWSKRGTKGHRAAFMVPYFIQLALNFAWTPIFFVAQQYWLAFGVLVAMAVMVLWLLIWTAMHRQSAMWMLLPYFLWLMFAGYLNIMIAINN